MIPKIKVINWEPVRVFSLEDAHIPKERAAPVLDNIPTNPPNKAQKRKMRIFHPSAREPANKSVKFIKATAGFPPATINAPDKIPKNNDTITSFVKKTNTIFKRGGIIPHIP